ncbi:jg22512 [Pararge aegeria aegeria]|uniref:Jg22512 protein n=1 Tax=Pararge aegeria aegeria TaxID=348720 RepID=A0A8S4R1K0_9NEOP|nr:jg22512 [Pararge aegeria aegeria]
MAELWLGTLITNASIDLHGFCYASKLAYGAVVNLSVVEIAGARHVSLLAAKTKVSPIKQPEPRKTRSRATREALTEQIDYPTRIRSRSRDRSRKETQVTKLSERLKRARDSQPIELIYRDISVFPSSSEEQSRSSESIPLSLEPLPGTSSSSIEGASPVGTCKPRVVDETVFSSDIEFDFNLSSKMTSEQQNQINQLQQLMNHNAELVAKLSDLTNRFEASMLLRPKSSRVNNRSMPDGINANEGYVNWSRNHNIILNQRYVDKTYLIDAISNCQIIRFTTVAGRDEIRNLFSNMQRISVDRCNRFPPKGVYVNINSRLVSLYIARLLNACDFGERKEIC